MTTDEQFVDLCEEIQQIAQNEGVEPDKISDYMPQKWSEWQEKNAKQHFDETYEKYKANFLGDKYRSVMQPFVDNLITPCCENALNESLGREHKTWGWETEYSCMTTTGDVDNVDWGDSEQTDSELERTYCCECDSDIYTSELETALYDTYKNFVDNQEIPVISDFTDDEDLDCFVGKDAVNQFPKPSVFKSILDEFKQIAKPVPKEVESMNIKVENLKSKMERSSAWQQ